jgi:cadmium resistance protein CadD (predicted permease)
MENKKGMQRTKLKLTFIGLIILCLIALAFIMKNQFEPMLWMGWFGSLAMVLGIYAGTNVAQKSVQGKNYNESLKVK